MNKLKAVELISPKDLEALEALQDEKHQLNSQISALENKQQALLMTPFLTLLKEETWKLNPYNHNIRPANHEAERTMLNLLRTCLDLGYHDYFFVELSDEVYLDGGVDDNILTLSLYIRAKTADETMDIAERHGIKLDRESLLVEFYNQAKQTIDKDLKQAEERVKFCQDALHTLETSMLKAKAST